MASKVSTDKISAGLGQDVQNLQDDLDKQWARYLDCLDRYHAAMTALSKEFAEGFLSLARANLRTPGRRRYGQDYYDDRMKALRTCKISANKDDRIVVGLDQELPIGSLKLNDHSNKGEPNQQPSPPATPTEETPDEKSGDQLHEERLIPSDPLRWFGILVPQDLRTSQSAFVSALETSGLQAVNSSREMRETEVELRRLRKAIKRQENRVGVK